MGKSKCFAEKPVSAAKKSLNSLANFHGVKEAKTSLNLGKTLQTSIPLYRIKLEQSWAWKKAFILDRVDTYITLHHPFLQINIASVSLFFFKQFPGMLFNN